MWVSILVVLDCGSRQDQGGVITTELFEFQSLLYWIVGRDDSGKRRFHWGLWCFNPCCIGLWVATTRPRCC